MKEIERMSMNVEQLKKIGGRDNTQLLKVSTKFWKDTVLKSVQERYNVNKTQAEYLLFDALTYNIPRYEVLGMIDELDKESMFDLPYTYGEEKEQ